MSNKPLFITGIGTYVGKTIASAVLCEQLKADYWKPVQSGDLDDTDSRKVSELISNTKTIVYPEAFKFKLAASPHQSSKEENIVIKAKDFKLPNTKNQLIIEGAGGLFVPLSNDLLMIDLIRLFKAEVVLVVRSYLGCINHTLLTLHALQSLNIPLKHVILNGKFNDHTADIILHHLPKNISWSVLPEFENLNKVTISLTPNQLP